MPFFLELLLLLLHHQFKFLTLFSHFLLCFFAIETRTEQFGLLALKLFSLALSFFFKFRFGLCKLALFLFLLSADFLLLGLKLRCEILIIDLEFIELVFIGLLVCFIPVIGGLTIDHWVHKEVVLVRADKDTVTMLKHHVLSDKLTIHLNRILIDVFMVGQHRSLALVTIEVKAALSVCDADTLDSYLWLKLWRLFTNKVVALFHCKLDHT